MNESPQSSDFLCAEAIKTYEGAGDYWMNYEYIALLHDNCDELILESECIELLYVFSS